MIAITVDENSYINVTLLSEPANATNIRTVRFFSPSPELTIIGNSEFNYPPVNWNEPNQLTLFSSVIGEYSLTYEVVSDYTNEIKTGTVTISVESESTGTSIILINTYAFPRLDHFNITIKNYDVYTIENDLMTFNKEYSGLMDGLYETSANKITAVHPNQSVNGGYPSDWFRGWSELRKIDSDTYLLCSIASSENGAYYNQNQPSIVSTNSFTEDGSSLILTDGMLPTYDVSNSSIRKMFFENNLDYLWYYSAPSWSATPVNGDGTIYKRTFDPNNSFSFTDSVVVSIDDPDVPLPRPDPDKRYVVWQEGKRMIQFVSDSNNVFYSDDLISWNTSSGQYPFSLPELIPESSDPFIYFNSRIIILGYQYFQHTRGGGQPGLYAASTDNGITWNDYQFPNLHQWWFGIKSCAYKPNSDIGVFYTGESNGEDWYDDIYPYLLVTTDAGSTVTPLLLPDSVYYPGYKLVYQDFTLDVELETMKPALFYNMSNDSFYCVISSAFWSNVMGEPLPVVFAYYCSANDDMTNPSNWVEINCTDINNIVSTNFSSWDSYFIPSKDFSFILEN